MAARSARPAIGSAVPPGAGNAESWPHTSQNRPDVGAPHAGHGSAGAAGGTGAAPLLIAAPQTSQ
ncbi:hypothetical protein [Nocardia miyunensis]|uniref:hypothetical protein n=1 Tax=Nocardia miyunensis TaxID=282684 RepID=UPI001FE23679|nr:hypothetical protein [Nocardia miyunensis]